MFQAFHSRLPRAAGIGGLIWVAVAARQGANQDVAHHPPVMGATFSDAMVSKGPQQYAASVRVESVTPDSDFEKAGIQAGDVIYSVWQAEGEWRYDYPTAQVLARFLLLMRRDEPLRFEILRQGGKLSRPLRVKWAGTKLTAVSVGFVRLEGSAILAAVPQEIAQIQNLPAKAWRHVKPADANDPGRGTSFGPGLVFVDTNGESSFAKAGLEHGDIVLSLSNGKRGGPRYDLAGLDSAVSALRQLAGEERLEITFQRPQQYTKKRQVKKLTMKLRRNMPEPQVVLAPQVQPDRQQAPAQVEKRAQVEAPAVPVLASESVAVTPNPVRAGENFDVVARFRAAGPGGSGALSVMFAYRILAGERVLAESKPVAVAAQSGALTEYVQHLKASTQPGAYVVEVQLTYGSKRAIDSVALRIE